MCFADLLAKTFYLQPFTCQSATLVTLDWTVMASTRFLIDGNCHSYAIVLLLSKLQLLYSIMLVPVKLSLLLMQIFKNIEQSNYKSKRS